MNITTNLFKSFLDFQIWTNHRKPFYFQLNTNIIFVIKNIIKECVRILYIEHEPFKKDDDKRSQNII